MAISAFTAEVSDEAAIDARVVLVNNSDERIDGYAGWLLSVPGGDPWANRAYRSSGRPIGLEAGDSATLEWLETAPVPPGSYTIEAWAHVAAPNGFRHSDSRPLTEYTVRITARSQLVRIEPPHQQLAIQAIDLVESSSPLELALTAALINERDTARSVDIRAELLPTTADNPLWWASDPVAAVYGSVEVPAEGEVSVDLHTSLLLMPGEYGIHVILTEDDGRTLLDQAMVGDNSYRVSEFGSSISRAVLPAGPLMVTSVSANPIWVEKDDCAATVEVLNRSSEEVVGEVWWHLAGPGDPEPWKYAAATSDRLSRTFSPGESVLVTLGAEGPVPRGVGYELSVWVHSGPESMSEHSDSVRFRGEIDVTDAEGS